ncbi:MAG: hypothetical protein EA401_07550, partial [Planctomycetota bacterium]
MYYGLPLLACALSEDPSLVHLYLRDPVHLAFTAFIALGAALGMEIMKRGKTILSHLTNAPIPLGQVRWLAHGYLIGVPLAIILGITNGRHLLDGHDSQWWGSSRHGLAGYVLLVGVGVLTIAAIQGLGMILSMTVDIGRICKTGLRLHLSHPDNCCGLKPLGSLIMRLWGIALLISAAVYLAVSIGYHGVEEQIGTWAVALALTSVLPCIAVAPLWMSSRALRRHQVSWLTPLDAAITERLEHIKFNDAIGIAQVADMMHIRERIDRLNIFPFNPRVLAFAALLNATQILVTFNR